MSLPHYRPDIDGLRAIAVLSVLGFHAFPDWIHGGFIGVDIFFVISGYLISYQIFLGLKSNNFSILNFYIRRIRRIFPALITVLLSSYILGWFFLLPQEFISLAKNILAGTTFTSNFLLWSEAGYFDVAAISKPLLHLWSLGIEEQFYIVWPLFLIFSKYYAIDIKKGTVWILTLSFLLNIALVVNSPVADFYFPLSRFWELLAGALISWFMVYESNFSTPSSKAANWISFGALVIVILGLCTINKSSLFPGFFALIPVLAASLFIIAGPDALVNRQLLSRKLFVWIGLISYPLYLWHWVLLSFMQLVEENAWAVFELRLVVALISFPLAYFTYKIVEKPLRNGANLKIKVALLLASMGFLSILSLVTIANHGFPQRNMGKLTVLNSGDIGHEEFDRYLRVNFYPCIPETIREGSSDVDGGFKRCFQSKKGADPQIAIMGDSHAEAIFIGIAEAASQRNIVYYNRDGLPLISNKQYQSSFDYVLNSPNIDTVILTSYWTMRIKQNLKFEEQLADTIAALLKHGKRVILLDDVPAFLFSPKRCKYLGMVGGTTCSQSRTLHDVKKLLYSGAFDNITRHYSSVTRIDLSRYFCDDESCFMNRNDKLLYRDTHHLNIYGSQFLGLKLFDAMGNIKPTEPKSKGQ